MLSDVRCDLAMDDEEFEAFRRSIIVPMIHRYEEMFPRMHGRAPTGTLHRGPSLGRLRSGLSPRSQPSMAAPAKQRASIDRFAPCPCGSGKKYKFCCGSKGR
jgi:uncharacterized protein YecA (UPF0149 family)